MRGDGMGLGCFGRKASYHADKVIPLPTYVVRVEDGVERKEGSPSQGPVYRSVFAPTDFPKELPAELSTCWEIFRNAVRIYPNNPLLGQRETKDDGKAGQYTFISYEQTYQKVLNIGAAIRLLGVHSNQSCGIYGANCPEWFIAMQACNGHTVYCVPLYDTLGENAIEFILKDAEIPIVFAHPAKIATLLKTLAKCKCFVKFLVSFGTLTSEDISKTDGLGIASYTWDQFITLGKLNPVDLSPPDAKDTCTIMYTSGTTGEPKGVRITNESLVDMIATTENLLQRVNVPVDENDSYLSFLPLAHIFDRAAEELFVYIGGRIGYWRGDAKLLAEDVEELKPTLFLGVPRIFDRIYTGFWEKLRKKRRIAQLVFQYAYRRKLQYILKEYRQDRASPFFDKLVFSKIQKVLGGRLRLVLSGAAPLTPHCEEFLRTTLGAPVIQGYGLTETCAGSFMAIPDVIAMKGTVGPPLPNFEVRLESIPELNYDACGNPPRGEICIRGKSVFQTYHKREELTKEVLINGWFHTGDVGEWQQDGAMKIIDRKKNIFKLSQGEYVAVENLESVYSKCPIVDMIWVYGNSFESVLVAVVVPVRSELEKWMNAGGFNKASSSSTEVVEEACKSQRAKDFVLAELASTAKQYKLKGFEFIKAVHLEPVPFNFERDFLTPTYKKKRPQLLRFYEDVIKDMYNNIKP